MPKLAITILKAHWGATLAAIFIVVIIIAVIVAVSAIISVISCGVGDVDCNIQFIFDSNGLLLRRFITYSIFFSLLFNFILVIRVFVALSNHRTIYCAYKSLNKSV